MSLANYQLEWGMKLECFKSLLPDGSIYFRFFKRLLQYFCELKGEEASDGTIQRREDNWKVVQTACLGEDIMTRSGMFDSLKDQPVYQTRLGQVFGRKFYFCE